MGLIVAKFGGTSVGNLERIRHVADLVISEIKSGNKVVVVLSAMSGQTDNLINLAKQAANIVGREDVVSDSFSDYDSIISTGEQITCGLLAIMLNGLGYKARSVCGWQVGLRTSDAYSKALIEDVEADILNEYLKNDTIPIVTGFQGICKKDGRITTLGRGGSDTSAVAVAVALKADRCDIYTDVDGVYTTDPRITNEAKKIDKISFEEMLEMASVGAKVLQTRSVGLAMRYRVKLRVLSTFDSSPTNGTILTNENEIMEQNVVTAVVSDPKEVQVTLFGLKDAPGVCAKIFETLCKRNINVDMIVQIANPGGTASISFTITNTELLATKDALNSSKNEIGFADMQINEDISKITIVGAGMKSNSGVAYQMFDTLSKEGINIIAISTSEIKTSVLIASKYTELAVRVLHTAFKLDKSLVK
jgi:aspartate kinase